METRRLEPLVEQTWKALVDEMRDAYPNLSSTELNRLLAEIVVHHAVRCGLVIFPIVKFRYDEDDEGE